MANVITTIRPTTELEAVNVMLASIGEAPLDSGTDLAANTLGDVELAIDILLGSTREVLSMGWRFNKEYGVEIAPTTTHSWVDTDGTTTTLNIFKKPVDLLAWAQTVCPENQGLDLVERPSKDYEEGASSVLVLYDRAKNRDGADSSRYPYIYLDCTYSFDFTQLPESARRFITVRAARTFAQQILGSESLRNFTAQDELWALRVLKREQGEPEALNIFDTADAWAAKGYRPAPHGGHSRRVYPGKA